VGSCPRRSRSCAPITHIRLAGLERCALDEDRAPELPRNAQGVPEADADPLIREPLKSSSAATPDLWPLWGSLERLPILVIRGAHSDILSVTTLARMQREKPGLEVLTVANRGNAPLLDEPGCVAAIERFLAAAPA